MNSMTERVEETKFYETKDAIELLMKQTGVVNALWGIYAAVSFTAAGFGLSLPRSMAGYPGWSVFISLVAAVGFGVFLFGHWRMLRSSVVVIETVVGELKINLQEGWPFYRTINMLIDFSYNVKSSRRTHIAIDCCSLTVLVAAPLSTSLAPIMN